MRSQEDGVSRIREEIDSLARAKTAIIADRDSSVRSMRCAAQILIAAGTVLLSGGIVWFIAGARIALAPIVAGSVCTILAAMVFRSSLVYAHQCARRLTDIDRSLRSKTAEIAMHSDGLTREE